jgi:hypothetical protein
MQGGSAKEAEELLDLAREAQQQVHQQIMVHATHMSGVPMSRMAINRRALSVHVIRLNIWRHRHVPKEQTAVKKLQAYVRSDEKPKTKRNPDSAPLANVPWEMKDLEYRSPAKKKIDTKDTPQTEST